MSHQLPLDLKAPDRFSRDRLVTDSALSAVLDVLLTPQAWISPHLMLLGPSGSGKTHLGHVFAAETGAAFLDAGDTLGLDVAGIRTGVVVDDADTASEEALFHLYNHLQITSQPLVLLTKKHPREWRVTVADLASRLTAMRMLSVPEPGEDLLEAILNKLFAERAISPSPDAVAYIASRMDRSVSAAQKIVMELEHYANGRAFNRSLVRDFFDDSMRFSFGDDDAV
ncbi:chromosomal replication initiator DnaA [Asticcacaulis solisilvae]|uniref:chromosomal replication initiator DnaA n=1 Tax=Asticcacaulis solisilvae TaxID=1217274 RepID=UPI003FD75AF4